MAWVLTQNIEATLNGVNPRHNILHEQIAQEPKLTNDTPNPIPNLIKKLAPTRCHNPHHKQPNL
jgi:hypothetical protein